MRDAQPGTIYLRDYQPPAWLINRTELHFELHEDHVIVASRLHLLRDGQVARDNSLTLDGAGLELLSVAIDGLELEEGAYTVTPEKLLIHEVPDQCATARAVEVVKFMVANGMDPKRISASGYAENDPVGDNTTDDGRQKNRRVELVKQ